MGNLSKLRQLSGHRTLKLVKMTCFTFTLFLTLFLNHINSQNKESQDRENTEMPEGAPHPIARDLLALNEASVTVSVESSS